MLKKIEYALDRYLPKFLWLMIPLEVVPFLFERDSMIGKILLLFKFAFVLICYLAFAKDTSVVTHLFIAIAAFAMAISTVKNGGIGVSILVLILLFSLNSFPRIKLHKSQLALLFLFLGAGAMMAVIYGLSSNVRHGVSFFSFMDSQYNSNEYGVLFLSTAVYLISSIHLGVEGKKRSILMICTYCCLFLLIILTGCRSAMLSMLVLAMALILLAGGKKTEWMYTPLVAFSVLLCMANAFICKAFGLGVAAESAGVYGVRIFGKALFSGRDVLWRNAIDGYLVSPILGAGSKWLQNETGLASSHNVYLGILLTLGFFPALVYLHFILSKDLASSPRPRTGERTIVARLCFMACIVVAAFECSFTDARFNFLFLPLLIKASDDPDHIDHSLLQNDVDKKPSKERKKQFSWLVLFAISMVLLLGYSLLPSVDKWITDNTDNWKPVKTDNLLTNQGTKNTLLNGVSWKFEGDTILVSGTAAGTSMFNWYEDSQAMPDWYKPGHEYKLHFKSDIITFRVLYYDEQGEGHWIVDTHEDVSFKIPEEARGLLVGVLLYPHEMGHEKIRPVLYDETAEINMP